MSILPQLLVVGGWRLVQPFFSLHVEGQDSLSVASTAYRSTDTCSLMILNRTFKFELEGREL